MQTVSSQFASRATADIRPLSWELRASFNKVLDKDVDFFTLGTSQLNGTDILAPSDNNVISLWDKFIYADYSSRLISAEITREELDPYSAILAHADVVLNNYDDYFTPNSGSPIDDYILPKRPFRLLLGFGGENLPQFVGLNEKMPQIDKRAGTVSFHLIDFLSYLYEQDISASTVLENVRTHEILDYLFQLMGLVPSQYNLDGSLNKITVFNVEKGQKFGAVAHKLLEAEIGRLYMDELGVIQFKNRYNYSQTPVYIFNKSNTVDYSTSGDTLIKNRIKVTSNILGVQEAQSIWKMSEPQLVKVGETIVIWASFQYPATTVIDPTYSSVDLNSSYYTAVTSELEPEYYTDIDLTSLDQFSKSAKLTFTNTGATDAYITVLDIWGTPAKVVDTISVEEKDETSISKYDDALYEIQNEYIQAETDAVSRATLILHDYKEYNSSLEIDVKGTPALQVGDPVTLDLDGYQGVYATQRITNIYAPNRFSQKLKVKKKVIVDLFFLDTSLLNGTDVLAP